MPVLTRGLQANHAWMEEAAMSDERSWRDDDRYRLSDEERSRWDSWRNEGEHGRSARDRSGYGREFGGSHPYGGYQGGYGRDDWRDEYPRGRYPSLGYGRDFGAPYRGYGREEQDRSWGRGPHERGWLERASDEVSSWFGNDDAQRRRDQDDQTRSQRGRGPKGYVRSDERIREDVCDRLADDHMVDASEIDVTVAGCEVTLAGTVDSREERRRAEECAERVSGVTHVQNNLRVARTGSALESGAQSTGARPLGSSGGYRNGTAPTTRNSN
jgi:osmotically-inducible protein OsmY